MISIKRFLDIILSILLMVLLAPIFVMISIIMKITANTPIFYKWSVIGKDGIPFIGYKFRSMLINADEIKI